MKFDFFTPKNYYGSHILAFSGWADLWVCLHDFPLGKTHGGDFLILIFYFALPIFLFLLALMFLILELFVKSKIKNRFLLENKIYDVFFDIGLILTALPIIWIEEICKFDPRPFVIMFLVFVAIRVGKIIQRRAA